MLATLSGMFIDVRPRQSSKALSPMLVTLAGMTVFLHPKTKLLSIVFIMALQLLRLSYTLFPFATTIDVRPLQPEYVYIFEYQLFVVNTVEKWLTVFSNTENKVIFNVFNFILQEIS